MVMPWVCGSGLEVVRWWSLASRCFVAKWWSGGAQLNAWCLVMWWFWSSYNRVVAGLLLGVGGEVAECKSDDGWAVLCRFMVLQVSWSWPYLLIAERLCLAPAVCQLRLEPIIIRLDYDFSIAKSFRFFFYFTKAAPLSFNSASKMVSFQEMLDKVATKVKSSLILKKSLFFLLHFFLSWIKIFLMSNSYWKKCNFGTNFWAFVPVGKCITKKMHSRFGDSKASNIHWYVC